MRNAKLYLKDILEAISAIEEFVKGVDLEAFRKDDMRSSAVIRKLEIIGEAAKAIPETIKAKYAAVPWKELAGMRDRLIHFYFGVKHELVWDTIKTDIPKLKLQISQVLSDLERE